MAADAEVETNGSERARLAVRATASVLFMCKMVAMRRVALVSPLNSTHELSLRCIRSRCLAGVGLCRGFGAMG